MSLLMLEVALPISVFAAVIYLLRVLASWILPLQWFWGGALAIFAAPALFAIAICLLERADAAPGSTRDA